MNNDKEKRGLWKVLKEKGYYIALILCACAIGISGYVYYRSTTKTETTNPSTTTPPKATRPAAMTDDGDLVPAIGTDPAATDSTTGPAATGEPGDGATTPPSGEKPVKTMWPVEGQTAAAYAMDRLAYNETTRDWRGHHGVDITAAAGTEVKAAADGTVYTVYEDDLMGTTVVVRHEGGYVTTYASLAEDTAVSAGDTVACGDVLGQVGQTALSEKALEPHVHFSVTCNSVAVDPAEFVE